MNLESHDRSIYENIYDITKEYMNKQDITIPFSKEVFMCSIGHKANEIDMQFWSRFEPSDFVNVAYLELLERFPLISDVEYWINKTYFKEKLIMTILSSVEFKMKKIRVYNNPYSKFSIKQRIMNKLFGSSVEEMNKNPLYRIYKNFPQGVKRSVRKILGLGN